MLKAIIFDMDGVIIDSEPQHGRAALAVFERYGIHVDLSYHEQFIGSSTTNMAKQVIHEFHLSVSVEDFVNELVQEKKVFLEKEGYISFEGLSELLPKLKKEGYKLAIASSSTQAEIQNTVKALQIRKYFDHLISSSQVANPKPAPDTFQLALKELGVNAGEALVIEDSENGVNAAVAAGIPCIGFIGSHSGIQNLENANVLLESYEDLKPLFFLQTWQRSQGQPVTIKQTKRLVIRELSTNDIEEMYPIYQNPEIRKYITDIEDYLEDEIAKQEAYIKNVYNFYGYGLWGVFSKTTKHLIGRCGIENHIIDGREEIMLSYLIDSEHWGYGYALECCNAVLQYAKEELEIKRIVAVIDKDNLRSIKTAEKLGMKAEKEILYKNRDCVLYSISL